MQLSNFESYFSSNLTFSSPYRPKTGWLKYSYLFIYLFIYLFTNIGIQTDRVRSKIVPSV